MTCSRDHLDPDQENSEFQTLVLEQREMKASLQQAGMNSSHGVLCMVVF